MRLEFHPEALAEYEASHFRHFEGDVRRCLVHVFPYAVLFSVESNYVLIVAVMHCNREPGYWRHRTKETS